MQLALILAVLAALVVSEAGPSGPVAGAGYRLALAFSAMLLVPLFAAVSSGVIARRLRDDFGRRHVFLQWFHRLRRVHVVLWLAVAGSILFGLHWGQIVRFNWHMDRAFLVDDVLILVPVLVPMVLSWAAFYEVDHILQVGLTGERSLEAVLATRSQYILLHLRHYLGVLLLPVLGLLGFQDGLDLFLPGVMESRYAVVVYAVPLVLLICFFPVLLRLTWETWPLPPGPLRERLLAAARRTGFRARDILVWYTGGMLVNAAVAGFVARFRYVFLTDGLLGQLEDDEIEAVFGHEVGHIRHRHLPLRILAVIAPVSAWLAIEQVFPHTAGQLQGWLADGGLGVQLPAGLAMLLAMGVYVTLVFGVYSRLLEGQADLFGCRVLAAAGRPQPVGTFISALEKLAAAGGADRKARTWQHASIARRVEFLTHAAIDPAFERRFHRRVRLANLLMAAVVVSPLVLGLVV